MNCSFFTQTLQKLFYYRKWKSKSRKENIAGVQKLNRMCYFIPNCLPRRSVCCALTATAVVVKRITECYCFLLPNSRQCASSSLPLDQFYYLYFRTLSKFYAFNNIILLYYSYKEIQKTLGFSLLTRCQLDLHSSGMLRGVDWQLVTDVLEPLVGPLSQGQAVKEVRTDSCPETSVTNHQYTVPDNPEERLSRTKKSKQTQSMKTQYLFKNGVFLENEGIAVTLITKNFNCISINSVPSTRRTLLRRQTTKIRQLLLRSFLRTSNRRNAGRIVCIGSGCN